MKKPFTNTEQEIMDLLVQAHNKFLTLKETHPHELPEWVSAIHSCQDVLGNRVLRRDYPDYFYSNKEKDLQKYSTEELAGLLQKRKSQSRTE